MIGKAATGGLPKVSKGYDIVDAVEWSKPIPETPILLSESGRPMRGASARPQQATPTSTRATKSPSLPTPAHEEPMITETLQVRSQVEPTPAMPTPSLTIKPAQPSKPKRKNFIPDSDEEGTQEPSTSVELPSREKQDPPAKKKRLSGAPAGPSIPKVRLSLHKAKQAVDTAEPMQIDPSSVAAPPTAPTEVLPAASVPPSNTRAPAQNQARRGKPTNKGAASSRPQSNKPDAKKSAYVKESQTAPVSSSSQSKPLPAAVTNLQPKASTSTPKASSSTLHVKPRLPTSNQETNLADLSTYASLFQLTNAVIPPPRSTQPTPGQSKGNSPLPPPGASSQGSSLNLMNGDRKLNQASQETAAKEAEEKEREKKEKQAKNKKPPSVFSALKITKKKDSSAVRTPEQNQNDSVSSLFFQPKEAAPTIAEEEMRRHEEEEEFRRDRERAQEERKTFRGMTRARFEEVEEMRAKARQARSATADQGFDLLLQADSMWAFQTEYRNEYAANLMKVSETMIYPELRPDVKHNGPYKESDYGDYPAPKYPTRPGAIDALFRNTEKDIGSRMTCLRLRK